MTPTAGVADPLALRFSSRFVTAWQEAVADAHRQKVNGLFLEVRPPSLIGASAWVHVPLLTYGDLTPEQGRALLAETGRVNAAVRCLDDKRRDNFIEGEPITMRVPLAGRPVEAIWDDLEPRGRKSIRKAEKMGLELRIGTGPADARAFKVLLDRTLLRLGMPTLSLRLFDTLRSTVSADFVFVSHEGQDLAALMAVTDGGLTWIPWSGSDERFLALNAVPLLFWRTIEMAAKRGGQIFDIGRSPYGGPTYLFKRQWGAMPVGLAIMHGPDAIAKSVYSRYELAQKLWRKLPASVAGRLGPWVCRHLADL